MLRAWGRKRETAYRREGGAATALCSVGLKVASLHSSGQTELQRGAGTWRWDRHSTHALASLSCRTPGPNWLLLISPIATSLVPGITQHSSLVSCMYPVGFCTQPQEKGWELGWGCRGPCLAVAVTGRPFFPLLLC